MRTVSTRLPTIDDLDVQSQRVLLRADFNVPLTPPSAGAPVRVADDYRIRAALATIEELRRRGAALVIVSHLDRPSAPDPALSMRPVAERLAQLTGAPVPLAPAVVGPEVQELADGLAPGAMLMLENARFEAGETRDDPRLSAALAALADLYVDDAFASAHRAHASNEGVARLLPSAAGRLMEHEVQVLGKLLERPARPLVAILGGAKVHEKIAVVGRFLELADAVCIGGALCFPFLASLGHRVGRSPCKHEDLESACLALVAAAGLGRLELPEDLTLAQWGAEDESKARVLDGCDVPEEWMGFDIGPRTAARYAAEIVAAGTVFWNGPMGRVELPRFADGTRAIAVAIASTSATTVVGGGETVQALRSYGLQERVSHVSTGGGATLQLLEGRELPALQVLTQTAVSAP